MTVANAAAAPVPRWLFYWSVLTAAATVLQLVVGAEVTTKQVGMADPVGLREPWYLFTQSLASMGLGPLVEHSHRTVGWVVGMCAIVLAAGAWATLARRGADGRRPGLWLCWLATGVLLAVIVQGLLGIFRVQLHALLGPGLAMIHGIGSHLVFALIVSFALFTSRTWGERTDAHVTPESRRLARLAWGVTALVLVQIVFGAWTRHLLSPAAQRLHMLVAFVVLGLVLWLTRSARELAPGDRALRRAAGVLHGLLGVQLLLGVEAWMNRFGPGVRPELDMPTPTSGLVRTGHFLVGALVFSAAVVLTLLLRRPTAAAETLTVAPTRPLEGAA